MAYFRLSGLPSELQDLVMQKCASSDLLSLARTCSAFHTPAIQNMYRAVDISVHNLPGQFQGQPGEMVSADNPDFACRDNRDITTSCQRRQHLFVDTLNTTHPEYAKLVLHFTWTYFVERDEDDESISDEPLWKALQLLVNAHTIDFVSLAVQREFAPPPGLFESAKNLRVGGRMSSAMMRSLITRLDPSKLVVLECDNLWDFGQTKDGEELWPIEFLDESPETAQPDGTPICRHPGPMRGHLQLLEGRCSNLRRLILRSVGNDKARDNLWSPEKDILRYKEWASFINSVRATIEILEIEQGLEPESSTLPYKCRPTPGQTGRPMDDRFIEHILPVLTSGNWPKLRCLKILGVGGRPRGEVFGFSPQVPPVAGQVLEQLLNHFGSSIALDVQENATKTFFHDERGYQYYVLP